MSFSEISKILRRGHSLTQAELAEQLKISKSCIAMIETGKNEPTANTLVRYADYFQCSTDFLLERPDSQAGTPMQSVILSEREFALYQKYKALPDDLKKRASSYLEKLIALDESDKILDGERQTERT